MKNYYRGKKVLVTGAAGFIGSHICQSLIEKGALVTGVVRNASRASNLKDIGKLDVKEADLTNKKHMLSLIKDQVIVIHAAAVDGGTLFKREHADKIFHDNVHMTMNILEALKKSHIEKFVFISTAEVYINLKNKKNIKEDDFKLFAPEKPEQWYAFSKIIGELSAKLIGRSLGIKVIIVRPANIYGPKDSYSKKRLFPILLQSVKKKKKTITLGGTGLDVRSFLYVDDYIENLLQLTEYSHGGTYNLAGEKAERIKNLTKVFSDISGIKVKFKDQNIKANKRNDVFLLNVSKIKATIPNWQESPYILRIKELLEQI